jgi:large repetitive protein
MQFKRLKSLSKVTVRVTVLAFLMATAGAAFAVVVLAGSPPPPPTIGSHPAALTSSTSATFKFTDPGAAKDPDNNHDTDPVAFLCSLDGASYTSCTSPQSYSSLADGSHTFRVEAQQESTSPSSPTTFTWTVDTKPPTVVLTFPVNKGLYKAASWSAGCAAPGYCGNANDSSGVTQVQLSIQQVSSSNYWTGGSFTSASRTWVNAALGSAGGAATTWSYASAVSNFPADGKYTVNVRASDALGHQTVSANWAKATFTIDRIPPPPPTLFEMPPAQTTSKSADFDYSDSEKGVTFQCKLDAGVFTPCGTGDNDADYANLSNGPHQFQVIACDAAGNCSSPTTYNWTIGTATSNFGISGNAVGLFYPSGATLPINIVITNPFNTTLTVTSVNVSVTGTSNAGCTSGNFTVVQNFSGSVNIPANTTESFMTAGVPQSSWPMVRMIDTGTNQDVCQTRTVNFSYSGSGTHN